MSCVISENYHCSIQVYDIKTSSWKETLIYEAGCWMTLIVIAAHNMWHMIRGTLSCTNIIILSILEMFYCSIGISDIKTDSWKITIKQ